MKRELFYKYIPEIVFALNAITKTDKNVLDKKLRKMVLLKLKLDDEKEAKENMENGEGTEVAKLHQNIVVKIPMTKEGLKAVKALNSDGIRTNVTLVFTAIQALLAARAGASFISPFVGRLDDITTPGMETISQIVQIFRNYSIQTEIIVASVRNPLHVLDAALMGADIATIPFKVIEQLTKHPLTDKGIENFLKDWEKVKKRL